MSKLNILIAYPYMKPDVIETLKQNQNDICFLLDSGAFTAWKAGKEIQLDDYCRFIETLPFKPWRYFTLDVIGDPEKSFKNYEIMLSRGFKPIPIFTRGEDVKMIDEYYKTSDVVGIGGLVATIGNKGFVKGIMKVVGDRKVHWLGFNPAEFISYYKPYMCDSSSWSAAYRFASGQVYDTNGRWFKINKKMFSSRPSQKIIDLINEHGIDFTKLGLNEEWRNLRTNKISSILTLTTRTWVKYQQDLMKKLDVRYFLACSAPMDTDLFIEAFNYWKGKQ